MIRRLATVVPALLLLTAAPPVNAQDGADPCAAAGACRVVETLRVERPDGEVTEVAMGMTLPWVTQGNVLLAPGDAVLIALDPVEGVLVPRLVSTGEAARTAEVAAGQIRFDLGLIERGTITLTAVSMLAQPIEYAALKVSLADGPTRTSVCTLMPGLTVFEQWEEPLYQFALWGFRPAADMACSEIDLGAPDQLERNE